MNFENDAALGLSSTETTRNAAANDLYGKSFKDLSEAQKQLTSLKMVEDANALTGALGQASRESDGWENVVGNMTQAWTDFKGEIGAPVLKVAVAGIKGVTAAVQSLNTEAIGNGIGKAFDYVSGSIKKAKDAIAPFIEGVKGIAGAIKGLMEHDGQEGRDILKGMGFSEETIMRMDGYAAKIAEFRHKLSDFLAGIGGLFESDGQEGRDFLASLGFPPDLITRIDNVAANLSAFRGNFSNTWNAIKSLLENGGQEGSAILEKLGFTDGFIQKAESIATSFRIFRHKMSDAMDALFAVMSGDRKGATDLLTKLGISPELVAKAFSLFDGLKRVVMTVLTEIGSFILGNAQKIIGFFRSDGAQIIEAVVNIVQGLGIAVGAVFLGIFKVIQFIMPVILVIIKSVWKNIQGAITGALDVIMGVVKIFSGLFTGDFKKMWEGLKQVFVGAVVFLWNFIQLTFFGKILGGAKMFVLSFKGFFIALWQGVIGLFKGNTTAALIMIKTAWSGILRNTTQIFGAVRSFFTNIWASIVSVFSGRLLGVRTMVLKAWDFIYNATMAVFDNVKGYFITFWGWVTDLFGKAASSVGSMLKTAWDFIVNITTTVFGLWLTVIKAYWGFIATVFTGALNLIKAGVSAAWNGIVSITTSAFNGIKNFLTAVWQAIYNAIAPVVQSIWNFISPIFSGMWELVKSVFGGIFKVISTIWSAISQTFMTVGAAIVGIAVEMWTKIYNAVTEKFTLVKMYITRMWMYVQSIFYGALFAIVKTVRDKFTEVSNETNSKFTAIKDFLTRIWTNIKQVFTDALNAILNFIRPKWDAVSSKTTSVFNSIKDFLSRTWTTIRNTITGIVDAVATKIRTIWDAIYTKTSTVFTTIKDFIARIWGNVRDAIGNALESVKAKVSGAWDTVLTRTRTAFSKIFDTVKGKFTDIVDAAKNLPKRIGDGLKNMAGKVSDGVNSLVNKMGDGLENGVNGVIKGINSVLEKLGVETRIGEITIPQYAKGTRNNGHHPGGPMVVGDGTGTNAGPELIKMPNGKQMLSPSKPTLMHGEKGTKVWSATETRKILAAIPHYKLGDKIKGGARKAKDWFGEHVTEPAKSLGNKAVSGAKKAGGKVKDWAVDVFDYIKEPGKLLDLALGALGVEKPKGDSFIDGMAQGGWNKVKGGAVSYIKGKLKEFGDDGGPAPGFGGLFGKSSSYGWRMHPILKKRVFHNGADYPAPSGTLIKAQAAGKVIQAAYHAIRGYYVRIKSGIMERIYQHNSKNLVDTGDMVRKGQGIGTVGSTGRSTGPHLHYEVKKNGKNINPQGFFKGGIVKAKQLAWVAEKGMEAIIPLMTNRAEGVDLWKQVGQHFGFDVDALMNQGANEMRLVNASTAGLDKASSSISKNISPYVSGEQVALLTRIANSNDRLLSEGIPHGHAIQVDLDGERVADNQFGYIDQKLTRQAEREMYFRGGE